MQDALDVVRGKDTVVIAVPPDFGNLSVLKPQK
jgi:hypothetical protein